MVNPRFFGTRETLLWAADPFLTRSFFFEQNPFFEQNTTHFWALKCQEEEEKKNLLKLTLLSLFHKRSLDSRNPRWYSSAKRMSLSISTKRAWARIMQRFKFHLEEFSLTFLPATTTGWRVICSGKKPCHRKFLIPCFKVYKVMDEVGATFAMKVWAVDLREFNVRRKKLGTMLGSFYVLFRHHVDY